MKKFILLLIACTCFFSVHAAYLKDVPKTLTQPDGTVLHCYASGDEYFNYLHDANGFTIMQHPQTGFWVYADHRDGRLFATDIVAGTVNPASKGLRPYNLISPQEWTERRNAWHEREMPVVFNRDDLPNHGTLNNLSIFIRFSDDDEFLNTYSSIDNMFNDTSENAISLRNYFRAASYNSIEIPTYFYPGHSGETIISYQDVYPRNYFQPYNESTNTNGYQTDYERQEREFSLLERAVNYINDNFPVPTDLNIDYDNDGLVDNVCFIVRGEVGEWSSLLWPHKWSLYDRVVSINGKQVYTFNFQLADATSYFNTSTMCHEMNHSLSAPDLYHYSYTGPDAVGIWDLMHANTTPPQHCGAYMKMKYGHWVDEIPEITESGTYTLNPISSPTPTNIAYKIATDDPNQFYVLEYRDNTSLFETGLPGSGLLIYRIDTRFNGNASYDPSNGLYDEVYIFRPGGSYADNGDLYSAYFSSDAGRTEFSASTSAYPFFSDGTPDNNFRIYNITNAGNTISFNYGTSSDCEPPTNLFASVENGDVTLSWDAVVNAVSYNVYRDGSLIGNTTETTYTDYNLFYGVHTYFLKSVDVNDLYSTSSESVSVTIEPEGGVFIGDGGTAIDSYFPSYSFFCYSYTQQIYTASEIGSWGSILSVSFFNDGTERTRNYDIYLVHTDKTTFQSTNDWIPVTESDLVFRGDVTMSSGTWTTITFDSLFVYDGVSNLALIVDDNTGSWLSPSMACRVFPTDGVQAMRIYSDNTNYDPYNPSNYAGTQFSVKNQILLTLDTTIAEPTVIPDTLSLSYRPNEAWMRPYTFQIYNPGNYTIINSISTDNPYFQLEEVEVPFNLLRQESREFSITHGSGEGVETGHLIINYGNGDEVQFDLSATAYAPAVKDVWETAYEVTSFPYVDSIVVADIPLYNNYNLPPTDTEDGADAVYKLVFTEDALLNASMTSGENGKLILYQEGFNGEGGPMETNCYTSPLNDEFNELFETQIGEGTSTFAYFPFYTWYDNSIAENLFLADELIAAGMKKSALESLSWYATNSTGYLQQNISIWLANVSETNLGTGTSHLTSDMTLVYTGSCTPQIGWNEFEFNESNFVWDGVSNLLICVQRNNGSYNSGINWQSHSTDFTSSAYRYRDGTYYDMLTSTYSMNTSINRPNIIFKGGYSAGSTITDMTLSAGTYYLVTSSTSDAWGIEINTDALSCPEMVSHPTPSDYDTDVVPTAVQLQWSMGERTTEYTLLLGTDFENLDTIVDWTRDLTESYIVTGLLNNANYFWQIKERNDGCPEGVDGPVWGFTTLLNGPQDLYAANYNIFEGDDVYLEWTSIADTNILSYNIYQDNVWIGNSTTNNYTVSGITYNMVDGYSFHVTGVYAGGESNASNIATVYVSGNGAVAGHVYEQDGITGIENATVSFSGIDEFGGFNTFTFTTDVDGFYTGNLRAGTYSATATRNGYQANHYNGSVSIVYGETTEDIDINLDEVFSPVSEVFAEYNPDNQDPNSPYVRIDWVTDLKYDFEESTMQGWTTIDADGDGYDWYIASNVMSTGNGHNGSNDCVLSQSYKNGVGALTPDNYLVSPEITLGGSITFWACAQDNGWAAEHFGVAVSTTNNDDPEAFTLLSEWTMTAKGAGAPTDFTRSGNRAQGNWYQYTVDLSAYSGQGYVAIRHFDCTDMFYLDIDDIAIREPNNTEPTRAFSHYRVYRTNAYNNGPYTEENTVLLADNMTETSLIDVTWQEAEAGVYKFGVSRMYEGNRESEIRWGELQQNNNRPSVSPRAPIYPLEDCSFGPSPENNVPENTTLPVFRGEYADCLIAMSGNSLGHFTLNYPANVTSYGIQFDEFTQAACYINGTYYFANSSGRFGIFDPVSGVTTIATDCPFGLIEYNHADGKLYGLSFGENANLYEVNPSDGSYTQIGTISTSYALTFTITLDGRFIICDAGDDCIKEYDPVTGDLTPIIYVDWNINWGQDMAMDLETNEVYWAACNATDGTHPLYKVDLVSGTLTLMGYFPSQASAFANATTANPIQVERESAIVWSNPIDKSMYLIDGAMNVTVTLNSGDSPEGVLVQFTNLNPIEQALYPVADLTLDATGYYAYDSLRRGDYQVQVSFNDYYTITEEVSIWDATALNYVLNEINYGVTNLYVSRTGWATWTDELHGNVVPSLDIDSLSAKDGRHFQQYQMVCTDAEDNVVFDITSPYCYNQLPTDNLVDGEIYHLKIAEVYSSGLSEWQEIDWAYQSCDNFEVVTELNMEINEHENVISWTYPVVENRSIVTNTDYAYVANNGGGNYAYGWLGFDIDDPSNNSSLNTNLRLYGGDYCGMDGYVYGTNGSYWYKLDFQTGEIVEQDYLGMNFYDCAWDYTSGTMYAVADNYLYKWNLDNNTVETIGSMSNTFEVLACDLDGQLWGIAIGGNLYKIGKTDASNEYVGSTGLSCNYNWQSGGFDHYTGKLYWYGAGFFAEVNTQTGNATVIDSNTGSNNHGTFCVPFNGNGYYSPVTGVLGAMVYRDGELLGFTTSNTYIDTIATGNHEYAIRVVYDGRNRCPNFNAYYAMSCPLSIGGVSYEVTVTANPTQGGEVTGSGSYINGFPCTVTATANEGYAFTNWVMEGEEITNTPEYTFRVRDNINMEANFIGFTPHWEVVDNPEYTSQSLIGIVNIDGEEITGNYMEVAALCGDECRGRQMLTYYPELNRFLVFMTIYGQEGDDITFNLYNHELGEETAFDCLSHLTLNEGVDVGSYDDPYVILFGIVQTTAVQTGWNWYSTFVEQEGIEGLEMLEASLGSNGIMIKSQSDGFDINYGNLWMGNLESISNEQMYMISTSTPIDAVVSGFTTNVSDHPITLYTGWTWIGYPHNQALDINDALMNLHATNGDVLKSKHSFSTYIEGQGWFGTLNTLEPGTGMMYHSKKNSNTTFTYSDASTRYELIPNLTAENNHWIPNDYEYPDNMSIMAVVELNHVEIAEGDFELAAFVDDKCLGSTKLIYIGPSNRYMAFLTLTGEENQALRFGLYQAATGKEYLNASEMAVFTPNAIVGSMDEPYIIHFDEATDLIEGLVSAKIYPNPIDRGAMLSIALSTHKTENVTVEIINALGEIVSTLRSNQYPIAVKAPSVSGVYMVRLVVDGEITYSQKLIVK